MMETRQEEPTLEDLLKKKGIGPEGSKSLKEDELPLLEKHLIDPGVSLTTKATILTALLLLEPNEAEGRWIQKVYADPSRFLPGELLPFLEIVPEDRMIKIITQLIAKKELSPEDGAFAMTSLLNSQAPEYLKGPFLEGERLKRESFDENKLFFEFLWNKSGRKQTDLPFIIDICDSYDGCTRSPNFSAFIACLLGAAGFPTLVHSIDQVAPKEGITSHQILKAAGKNVFQSLEQVASSLQNQNIGWGYADQQVFFPELYALKRMRKEMVKRPFLATFEKLLQPVRAQSGNLLFTGYTHPHYRTELVSQLIAQKRSPKALVVKGTEGSSQMSLSKSTTGVFYNGHEVVDVSYSPEAFDLEIPQVPYKFLPPKETVEEGLKALSGIRNEARSNILYGAMVVLDTFELMDKNTAKTYLPELLDKGKAMDHWYRLP